jgi:hypothetical protein
MMEGIVIICVTVSSSPCPFMFFLRLPHLPIFFLLFAAMNANDPLPTQSGAISRLPIWISGEARHTKSISNIWIRKAGSIMRFVFFSCPFPILSPFHPHLPLCPLPSTPLLRFLASNQKRMLTASLPFLTALGRRSRPLPRCLPLRTQRRYPLLLRYWIQT